MWLSCSLLESNLGLRKLYLSIASNESVEWLQMKPIEQYFPVVLFIILYKVVLTFESG